MWSGKQPAKVDLFFVVTWNRGPEAEYLNLQRERGLSHFNRFIPIALVNCSYWLKLPGNITHLQAALTRDELPWNFDLNLGSMESVLSVAMLTSSQAWSSVSQDFILQHTWVQVIMGRQSPRKYTHAGDTECQYISFIMFPSLSNEQCINLAETQTLQDWLWLL